MKAFAHVESRRADGMKDEPLALDYGEQSVESGEIGNGPGRSIRVWPNRQITPSQAPGATPGTDAPAMSTVTPPPFFQGVRR